MGDPRDDPGSVGAPDVEVIGVHWERIQLVVTVRARSAPASAAVRATGIALRRAEQPSDRLEPREHVAGTGRVRFNLFAADDQMPVAPGTWVLVHRTDAGHDAIVPCAPDAVATPEVERAFVHPTWTVRMTPAATNGHLEVRVAVRATRGGPPITLAGRWNRLQRAVRQRAFRAAVRLVRLLPRGRRLVVFTSDSRAELGGNLELVHDRLVERGLDRRLRLRSILKESVRARRSMLDRVRLAWLLARADVILLDDYQPAIYQLPPHPGVRVVQLWHAWGAFKTVGYSRIGKPGGPNPYSRVHKSYTHAIVSSEHEVPFYAEAFGLPESRIVPLGTPRMDEFLNPSNQRAGRDRAHAAFPATRDHAAWLFAPTFRGDGARDAAYPTEILDLEALHALAAERNAVVLLKLHPFVPERIKIPERLADRLLDASRASVEVNDLLLVADLLVTDYSSLVFEFAALRRPMLFFAFDLDDYVASRDFYEPFESFAPGPIVRTFPELLAAIRGGTFDLARVERFARDHLPSEPGSATDRIIDQLILAP